MYNCIQMDCFRCVLLNVENHRMYMDREFEIDWNEDEHVRTNVVFDVEDHRRRMYRDETDDFHLN